MPYYRGDYVGGSNYYRGDPLLGALVGGLVGKAAKWAAGRIAGSGAKKAVAAGAAGTAISMIPGVLPSRAAGSTPPILIGGPGGLGLDPLAALPGGRPLVTFGRKKYRRMNPLNPKALKRALRRAEGFEKFARQTVNALRSGPKKFKSAKRKRS